MSPQAQKVWNQLQKGLPACAKHGKVEHFITEAANKELGTVTNQHKHRCTSTIVAYDVKAFKHVAECISNIIGLCAVPAEIALEVAIAAMGKVVTSIASKTQYISESLETELEVYTFSVGVVQEITEGETTQSMIQVYEFSLSGQQEKNQKFWGLFQKGTASVDFCVNLACILIPHEAPPKKGKKSKKRKASSSDESSSESKPKRKKDKKAKASNN